MEPSSPERALKKKLQAFLQELQRVGTIRGFKHFTCYIRGREELVVSVRNNLESQPSLNACNLSGPPSRKQSISHGDSFSSSQLPYDKGSLVLSHNTQMGLSGLKDRGVGLPPASPSGQESPVDSGVTLFLVAGYARYNCPYVWVRSNHDRLLKLVSDMDDDKDSPLRLKSTTKWKDGDVQVIDIIGELVRLCTYPAPRNPFEVDLDYFSSLSQPDQLLASAAMVSYLQKIVINSSESKTYTGKVFEDLQHMGKLHFTSLQKVIESGSLPVLQQQKQQQQQPRQHLNQRSKQRQPFISAQPPTVRPNIPANSPVMSPPLSVYPSTPVNASGQVYGQGPGGAFPGGFERMPAPSMF